MYAIPTAFVSALFVVFGLYVLITQGVTRLSAPFLLMCATTFAWQGTWTLLFQTRDPHIASVLVRVGYLFILFLPTTFYHFVTEVAARRRERPILLASYGLCLVFTVLLPGDEVVSGYRHYFFGYYPSAGPLHPLHVLQTILLAGRSGQLLLAARKQAGASISVWRASVSIHLRQSTMRSTTAIRSIRRGYCLLPSVWGFSRSRSSAIT